MPRVKLLTDYTYSPTKPASEDAIRSEIDDAIQEVYDASAKPEDTVNLIGDQTVAGIKTFSSSPVVPTPTTNLQASTKKYVDDGLLANKNGDHLGTWQGYTPIESDPGIQAVVNNHEEQLNKMYKEGISYTENIDSTGKYLFTDAWFGRRILMLGDSHSWGQGSSNYQGTSSGYSVHAPWIHNNGYMDKLRLFLEEKINSKPWVSVPKNNNVAGLQFLDYGAEIDTKKTEIDNNLYNASPEINGKYELIKPTSGQVNIYDSSDNFAAYSTYGHNGIVGYLRNFQLKVFDFVTNYDLTNALLTNPALTYTTNKYGATVAGHSYIFVDSPTFDSLKLNKKYYNTVLGVFKIKEKNEFTADLSLSIVKENNSLFTLSELQSLSNLTPIYDLTITKFPMKNWSRYAIFKIACGVTTQKHQIKFNFDFGEFEGTEIPDIYRYTSATDYNSASLYTPISSDTSGIVIDLSVLTGEQIFKIDFKQKKTGNIEMYYFAEGSETVALTSSTTTRGMIFSNDDLIKNFSFGGHTLGAMLGQEPSFWAETANHVSDALYYMYGSVNACIFQAPIVNEYISQTPIATFKTRLDDLLTQIDTDNILIFTTMGNINYEYNGLPDPGPVTYQMYFDALAEWAELKGGNVTYFDGRNYIKQYAEKMQIPNFLLFSDGIHPSSKLNEILYNALKEIVVVKF